MDSEESSRINEESRSPEPSLAPPSQQHTRHTVDEARCLFCPFLFGGRRNEAHPIPPDDEFHADSLITLSGGITAYRLTVPKSVEENVNTPVIVCMHGLLNSSYMWSDVSDLLTEFEQGPKAKVLVFDFYGRGRSPWSGIDITLDVLVNQTKELLDFLNLSHNPVSLVGWDLGGAVAAGFAAKFPTLVGSLSFLSAIGVKYKPLTKENALNRKYVGEYMILKQKKTLPIQQEADFFDKEVDAPHRYLIDKQMDMIKWQIKNTPGYLGAVLSTYRNFPLRGLSELYTAIGRHSRPTLVVWGYQDTVCPFKKCIKQMEDSFPEGTIVDVLDCGHNCVAEKFEEVIRELLSFHKDVFEDENAAEFATKY